MTQNDPFAEYDEQPPPVESRLEEVCELPNGATLYREPNGAGGHCYWSDEIASLVLVFNTSLVSASTLVAVLTEEWRRRIAEQREQAAVAKETG